MILLLKKLIYPISVSIIWFVLYFGVFSSIIDNANDSGCLHLVKVIFGCSSFLAYSVYKNTLNLNRFFLSVFLFPLLISSGITFCLLEQIINTCGYYNVFNDSSLKRFLSWFDSLGKHHNPFIISVTDPDPNFPSTYGERGVKLFEGTVHIYKDLVEGSPIHKIVKETIEVPKEIKDRIPPIANYNYEFAKNTTVNSRMYLQTDTINKVMSDMENNPLIELMILNDAHSRCLTNSFGPPKHCSLAEIAMLKRANLGSFTRCAFYDQELVGDFRVSSHGRMMETFEEYNAVTNVFADRIRYIVHKNPNILGIIPTEQATTPTRATSISSILNPEVPKATSISSILNPEVPESSSSREVSRKRAISPQEANNDTANLNRNHPIFKRSRRN